MAAMFAAGFYAGGFVLTLAAAWIGREPWPERIVVPLTWFWHVPVNLLKG